MTYKADELFKRIEKYDTTLLKDMYGEEIEEEELEDGTKIKYVDAEYGDGDGSAIWFVFKVGNQLFQREGSRSSWGDDWWQDHITEVEPVQVLRTEYRAKQ